MADSPVTAADKEAALVMGTNNLSIVSKRSVERYYYPEPHFIRYFVRKPQRRSPLINRGYWLRMYVLERTVQRFLDEPSEEPKAVINLGCGFDSLPFRMLSKNPQGCENARFVDVDHHQLMVNKQNLIRASKELSGLLTYLEVLPKTDAVLLRSKQYVSLGCDLSDLHTLGAALEQELAPNSHVLFMAEVSITYMHTEAADSLISFASKLARNAQFCLLEQYLPDGLDNPFASVMVNNFKKLGTPLHSVEKYPTLQDQEMRFIDAGWVQAHARNLWDLWSDDEYIDKEQRLALEKVEVFDEWEEFALFASHYFLLFASNRDHAPRPVASPEAKTADTAHKLVMHVRPKVASHRRFGATFSLPTHTIGFHGGVGPKGRLSSTDLYSPVEPEIGVSEIPPEESGPRLCHTISSLTNTDDTCLLVGGRNSPLSVLGDCWLRRQGRWEPTGNITPRYRHCALTILSGCVLVYGGRDQNQVFGDFLLWREGMGWKRLIPSAQLPARFGASIIAGNEGLGLIFGGMSHDGVILDDVWSWKIQQNMEIIELEDVTSRFKDQPYYPWMPRFGASISKGLIIGGVSTRGCVPHSYEIMRVIPGSNLVKPVQIMFPVENHRPLFVGHFSRVVDDQVLIAGGGAVCFSFGVYWNSHIWVLQEPRSRKTNDWHLVPATSKSVKTECRILPKSSTVMPTDIPRMSIKSQAEFQDILFRGKPIIISDIDFGPCVKLWTKEYLESAIGRDRPITIHNSSSPNMSFQSKNFSYIRTTYGSFSDNIHAGASQYLRSLSAHKPSELPSRLAADFPGLAGDFSLPTELEFVRNNEHSSPLRISGPVNLWLHYDVMANTYHQIQGSKMFVLYPPCDVRHLRFPAGLTTSTLCPFDALGANPVYPPHTHPHVADVSAGDTLFIPPLWAHTAKPTSRTSIAVNVFFRNMDSRSREGSLTYAAGRDVYGNRDIQAYENGRRDLDRLVRSFGGLPADMRRFYLERLADELGERAREV